MPDFGEKVVRIEDVHCRKATEKAICVKIPELGIDQWIPQSQIDDDSEVYKEGDVGTLVISEWIAEKKELR